MHDELTWVEVFAYAAMIFATGAIVYELFKSYA